MKYRLTAIAVLLASLALASTATAHPNLTASASQVCDEAKGEIVLTASFSNEGFVTQVTATDSQAGVLGSGTAPASFTTTFKQADRAAGTVSFAWSADDGDSGTITADYGAVSGCEAPPPPTTTTTTPPPPPPPAHHSGGGPTPRIGTSVHGKSPEQPPNAVQNGTLPFSGLPLGAMVLIGAGLLGAGVGLRKRV